MNIQRLIKYAAVTLTGLALASTAPQTQAQTIITGYTNTFPNPSGVTGQYAAPSFIYWYSVYQDNTNLPVTYNDYNLTASNDAAMDYTGDTNVSGSMYVYAPFTNNAQDQNVFYFTFDNQGPYDESVQMQVVTITNISWYIHVSSNSVPNADGNFGTLSGGIVGTNVTSGYVFEGGDYLTIPGSATNGWVLMSETNPAAFVSAAGNLDPNTPNNAKAFGVCWDQNSYGTSPDYPGSPMIYWIDNVTVQTAAAPPPPPPPPVLSISPAVQGLNLFTASGGSSATYNREDIEATQQNYSWVGASGPVSYSFTITNYPVGSNDGVQCQIFLCPAQGTETDPDWAESNIIFLDMENNVPNNNVYWSFRYKTNEANDNIPMLYGSGVLATIGSSTAVGTWTLTFNDNTNVTMTVPTGASTNFSIPDSTGATSALFANGVDLYFGVQANNAAGVNDHIVASDFKVTGLGSADFDDNFIADAGVLNSRWTTNAEFPSCVQLVGPGEPFWVQWTAPASGYALQSTPTLLNPTWTLATNNPIFTAGTNFTQLISTNDYAGTNAAFFALVQRTFNQLQVLLPGETAAPGTATGETGSPTPYSRACECTIPVTVNAVDDKWYPVAGASDTVTITTSDPSAGFAFPPGTTTSLVNGTIQFQMYFSTTNSQATVTVTDNTNTNIPPVTLTVDITP